MLICRSDHAIASDIKANVARYQAELLKQDSGLSRRILSLRNALGAARDALAGVNTADERDRHDFHN